MLGGNKDGMIMTTGEKLAKLRKSKNLSQIQLAGQLGVSRQAISKWESNSTMPGIDSLIEISNFFDVTIDYLVKDVEIIESNIEKTSNQNNVNTTLDKMDKLNGIIKIIVVALFGGAAGIIIGMMLS